MSSSMFTKRQASTNVSKAPERELPWVEKYRPKNLSEVTAQDHTVNVLKKTLESANLPHMLFYGPPGTGKTSTILALTKELYGASLSKTRVLELNASDERGISIVREKVKNFARLTVSNPSKEDLANHPCPPYKIIILDEADSMTADAQSALRRTMETYSGVTRFCLICNYITRIIDPLASRCSKFRFKPLDNDDALKRLQDIAKQEKIRYEDGVLELVLKIASGDLRKAITFLQSATRLHAKKSDGKDLDGDFIVRDEEEDNTNTEDDYKTELITKTSINEISGSIPSDILSELIKVAQSKNFSKIFKFTDDTISEGWSVIDIINQLHDELILNDEITAEQKNAIALYLFEGDQRLTNGTDEHIQLLNLLTKISKVL